MTEILSLSEKVHSISSLCNSQNNIQINLRISTLQPTKSNDIEEEMRHTTLRNITNIEEGNSNLFSSEKKQGNLNLITAVEYNKINKVKQILSDKLNKKKELDSLNEEGISSLHIAIIKGNFEMVKLLLENGANPNLKSEFSNQTPLHFAYLNQNSLTDEIISLLKKYNANDEIYDKNKKKPSDYNYNTNNNVNYLGNNSISNNNTVTLITMENHFDSFITTNKDQNSNINTIQSQNKNEYNLNDDLNIIDINDNLNNKNNNLNDSLNNYLSINEKDNSYINSNVRSKNLNEIDDNNLEYTNSNIKQNSIKNYKIGESPVIGIKSSDIKFSNSFNFNSKSNNKDSEKRELFNYSSSEKENNNSENIDDFYKHLIINKRKNFQKRYKKIGYHNNSHNSNIDNCKYFNNNNTLLNNNDSYKQRTTTIINIGNNSSLNNSNSNNNNITCVPNIINTTYNSTQSQTGKNNKGNYYNSNLEIINNSNNKNISEFKINEEFNPTIVNNNTFNYENLHNISLSKILPLNIKKKFGEYNEKNCSYLKTWLMNIQLESIYNNFIENNIYDILCLIDLMKSYQTKLQYEDIEQMLKIKKPGFIYRILCKLEMDSGLIDENIINFLIKIPEENIKNKKTEFQILISNEYFCGCFCNEQNKKSEKYNPKKKNDLKQFLLRNGIMKFYQNFTHNGFDLIEYLLIQMYSSFQITDEIIENCFHIYEENDRKKVLKSLVEEMKKINLFISSKEYLDSPIKNKIKYQNFQIQNSNESKEDFSEKKTIESQNAKNDCSIF